jgi:hypothetical protein
MLGDTCILSDGVGNNPSRRKSQTALSVDIESSNITTQCMNLFAGAIAPNHFFSFILLFHIDIINMHKETILCVHERTYRNA